MGYTQKWFCQEVVLPRKHCLFVNQVTGFVDKGGAVKIVSWM